MALSPDERKRIAPAAAPAAEAPAAPAAPVALPDTTVQSLEAIELEIEKLRRAGVLDAFEASMYRLHLDTLRDARAKPAERQKALDMMAKLRGMYRPKDAARSKLPADKTMRELLDDLAELSGVNLVPVVEFKDLEVPQEPIKPTPPPVGLPTL